MATSPWNKRFLIPGQKKKIPPPSDASAQIPTANAPIQMHLNGSDLIFENGTWRQEGTAPVLSSGRAEAEIKKLQKQNLDLKEQNNLLEFKVQLLIDMLTAASVDISVLQENEQKYTDRERQRTSKEKRRKR